MTDLINAHEQSLQQTNVYRRSAHIHTHTTCLVFFSNRQHFMYSLSLDWRKEYPKNVFAIQCLYSWVFVICVFLYFLSFEHAVSRLHGFEWSRAARHLFDFPIWNLNALGPIFNCVYVTYWPNSDKHVTLLATASPKWYSFLDRYTKCQHEHTVKQMEFYIRIIRRKSQNK